MKYQILKIVQNLTSIWLKQEDNQKVLQFEKEKKLFGFPKYVYSRNMKFLYTFSWSTNSEIVRFAKWLVTVV